MKIILLLLSTLAPLSLARNLYIPSKCKSTLLSLEVCAYVGCFINIDQRDIEFINCERELRGRPPLNFYSEGKCGPLLVPKCETFEF
ncbi:uncharacterized protein LOC26527337 [Drosophila mojavensis]|uniref:Uncharacterized protein n=1 Tax=Drosophila mojavensis TaxID=7230 RepID=A0A0Q9XEF2_DROMO|nr:uncharacterized protein LOC26527337 [Drosophila mojavensis]KRG04186.1 uncharacterized protein Dmoj_GI25696 [Drosophila mojavensis]